MSWKEFQLDIGNNEKIKSYLKSRKNRTDLKN